LPRHLLNKLVGARVTAVSYLPAIDAANSPILTLGRIWFDSGVVLEFRVEPTNHGPQVVPRAVNPSTSDPSPPTHPEQETPS